MISIPLFLTFLSLSLKEATVLSLVAVAFGTIVNLVGQLSKVNKQTAILLSLSGIIANYGSLFLKPLISDFVVAGLLTMIASYSLWSVWSSQISRPPKMKTEHIILKSVISGILLGVLTSLTGLGGGVILVPILIKFFGRSYSEALPTSLATILLISASSFIFQSQKAFQLISLIQLASLWAGTLVAFFLLKILMGRLETTKIDIIRKLVFSVITVYSTVSVITKVM